MFRAYLTHVADHVSLCFVTCAQSHLWDDHQQLVTPAPPQHHKKLDC